jgi:hypothetical protein
MTLLLRFAPAVVVLLGVSSVFAQPAADERARARVAFERGVVEMEAGRWQPALDAFQESIDIRATQVAILNAGNCLENLHRVREAIQMYERFLADFGREATAQRRAHAEEKIRSLRATMGTLTIAVDVAGAAISVDGESAGTAPLAQPLLLPAGPHVVVARVDGRPDATMTATVRAGETTQIALVIPAAPPDEPEPEPEPEPAPVAPQPEPGVPARSSGLSPTFFWMTAGLAVVGAIGTSILGGLVIAKDAEYRDSVPRTEKDQSAGERLVLMTDVALGVTVVAAVGAVILLTQTDFGGSDDVEPAHARLELDLGPASAGLRLRGSF